MKKIWLFVFLFFLFIPVSKAAYYIKTDDGNYRLCDGSSPSCITVSPNQGGVTFNLNDDEIVYNNIYYYFDGVRQEEYYKSLYGTSRMYFYQDKNGRYVLCDTDSSCKTYTFDRLTEMGASITNQKTVVMNNAEGPGVPGDTYYFNAQKQAAVNEENANNQGTDLSPSGNANNNVSLEDSEYCGKLKEPLKFIGNIVLIVKILIPIIIIGFGMIDFFKAIVGSKDDEIKKSSRSLIFRCVAGVVIFFIPTIVSLIFSLVDSFANIEGEFNACQKCVLNVRECK